MGYLLLVLSQVAGLVLVPFGLPGTWLQVISIAAFAWATDFTRIGWPTIVFVAVLALAAEVIEFVLGGRYARKYGGSPRAAWGAIIGGLVGALLGTPVPIVGSVVGAFLGAFCGAAVFELTRSEDWRSPEWRSAMRVGWGAFVGRLVAVAMKSAIAVAIGATALLSALA